LEVSGRRGVAIDRLVDRSHEDHQRDTDAGDGVSPAGQDGFETVKQNAIRAAKIVRDTAIADRGEQPLEQPKPSAAVAGHGCGTGSGQ